LLEFGIGLTDLVKRPSRAAEEIERHEFAEGRVLLAQKLTELQPKMVAFNGKMTYEWFAGRPCALGAQPTPLYGAKVFVLPSTSGRNAGADRGVKMRYFRELAELLRRVN